MKRTILDARMAWKAKDSGAELKEGFEVGTVSPKLDRETGLWTVESSKVGAHHHQAVACTACNRLSTILFFFAGQGLSGTLGFLRICCWLGLGYAFSGAGACWLGV